MAMLLRADGTRQRVYPEKGAHFSLDELKGYVGGYIELVRAPQGLLCVNEEGRLQGLPINEAATVLCGQMIVGDAVYDTQGEIN